MRSDSASLIIRQTILRNCRCLYGCAIDFGWDPCALSSPDRTTNAYPRINAEVSPLSPDFLRPSKISRACATGHETDYDDHGGSKLGVHEAHQGPEIRASWVYYYIQSRSKRGHHPFCKRLKMSWERSTPFFPCNIAKVLKDMR